MIKVYSVITIATIVTKVFGNIIRVVIAAALAKIQDVIQICFLVILYARMSYNVCKGS